MFFFWSFSMLMVTLCFRLLYTSKHYLSALIVLEVQMVIVLLLTMYQSVLLSGTLAGFLIMMTFIVCEAAMGAALLLSLIKSSGSDLMSTTSIGW
uniref:NADH dehydrogenase subunit 4L n=1 Tax=Reinia holotrema TaxID=1885836 RepID=A0A224A9G6_9EUPU|nr:NADH dehydrogenase subunit 4L [Reinia holotrema]